MSRSGERLGSMEHVVAKTADGVRHPQPCESPLQPQGTGTRITSPPRWHWDRIWRPESIVDRGEDGALAQGDTSKVGGGTPPSGRSGKLSEGDVPQRVPLSAQAPAVSSGGTCRLCSGAGYLRNDAPPGHPLFGKPVACECKAAELACKRRQQLYDLSDLCVHHRKNFTCFSPRVPGVQEAYQAAREYARHPHGWLVLVGGYGCGKTHLAAAIANDCLGQGWAVYCSSVPDMLDHLRAAFAPTRPIAYDWLFSLVRTADLLVLDDLGAEQASAWAGEKLLQLIDYRYTSRLPMVATANGEAFQALNERIRSRLQDSSLSEVVAMDRARDYRPFNRSAG